MGAAADVYAQELAFKNHGFIDEDGQFHRLFNATVGSDHPYNQHGVPADFLPLGVPSHLLHVRRNHLPPGPISSNSVKSYKVGSSASMNLGGVVTGELAYRFDCSTAQGAVLLLMDAAKKTYVLPSRNFTSYMGRHHAGWYDFATGPETCGLLLRPEDIVLVRGTIKTAAWALGAYVENGDSVHGVSFSAQVGHVAGAAFDWSFSSQISTQFEHRAGGCLDVVSALSESLSLSSDIEGEATYELELPEVVAERRQGGDTAASARNLDNQCVFLSCYRIKYRLGFLKKITAAASPGDFSGDGEPSPGVYVDSESGSVFEVPTSPKYRTPVDDILDYILDTSDANVAIASDDDVVNIIQGVDLPDDFSGYLKEIGLPVSVDENGTGTLSLELLHTIPNLTNPDSRHIAPYPDTKTGSYPHETDKGDGAVWNDPMALDMPPSQQTGRISPSASPVSSADSLTPSDLSNRGCISHTMLIPTLRQPIHTESRQMRSRGECWTCRVRRKKCNEEIMDGGSCKTCHRLGIQCLGWESKPPEWIHDKDKIDKFKVDIKAQTIRYSPPKLLIPEPRYLDNSSVNETVSAAINIRRHTVYYFQNVRQLHFVFASHSLPATLVTVVSAEPQGAFTHAICALAALHAARAGTSLDGTQQLLDKHIVHKQFFSLAYGHLSDLKTLGRHYSEKDAIAAIYLIAYQELLGEETSLTSLELLEVAYDWFVQTGIHEMPNPKLRLATMTLAQKFAFKAMMWIDIMTSVVFVRSPRFLAVYRRLLYQGIPESAECRLASKKDVQSQIEQFELRMDLLVGCPDDAALAIAEIAALASWKKSEATRRALSTRELVRRGDGIKQNLRRCRAHKLSELPSMSLELDPLARPIPKPSEAQRLAIARIYRDTAELYLHTVLNGPHPDVPEIGHSVASILTNIQSIQPSIYDRALVFSIVLTGCMTTVSPFRNMLSSRCNVHKDAEFGVLFTQALSAMQRVWDLREAATTAKEDLVVDWCDVMRQSRLNLLTI